MKKVYRSISSFSAWLCAIGLSLLGYSCDEISEPGSCMYGTPNGDYEIKGSVTTEDGKPVENATIRVTDANFPSGVYAYSTTSSNKEGVYETNGNCTPVDLKVVCIPSDPTLEPDSTIVKMKYEEQSNKKHDSWYVGLAKRIVDFKLKKKSSN